MNAVRPCIVRSEDELVGKLRGRRLALGMTQAELNDRIGFPDSYVGKLEAPNRSFGRRAAWGIAASLSDWLDGLGLCLVLMTKDRAAALVADATGADLDAAAHVPYPGRDRDRPVVEQIVVRRVLRFARAA